MIFEKELKNLMSISYIDRCYFIFLSIMVFLTFSPIENTIMKMFFGLLACIFWSIKFINTKYTKKEYLILIVLILLSIISVFTSHRESLFLSILALAGSKDINLRKIVKTIFIIGSTCFLVSIIIYFYQNGLHSDIETIRYIFGIPLNVSKNTLGYHHANYTYTLVLSLLACYLYINYDSLNIKNYILAFIVGTIFFILTFARTGFIILIFMLLLCILLKKKTFVEKISPIIKNFPSIIVILSFLLPLIHKLYPFGIMEKINSTLQGRIFLSHEFIEFFTPTLFGRNVDDITGYSGYYLKCDNSFIIILCAYGIILFGIFLYMTFKLNKLNLINQDIMLLNVFYLYCFAEAFFVVAFLNISFFVFKYMLFEENTSSHTFSLLSLFKGRIKNG